jgi:hypothetical protein
MRISTLRIRRVNVMGVSYAAGIYDSDGEVGGFPQRFILIYRLKNASYRATPVGITLVNYSAFLHFWAEYM